MCICGFDIQGCVCFPLIIKFNGGIKEVYFLIRVLGCKLDGGVTGIQVRQEVFPFSFPIGPDAENVIYEPPPNQGFEWKL